MEEFVPRNDDVSALPESPQVPMEFLSRSWSASAFEIGKALSPQRSPLPEEITPHPLPQPQQLSLASSSTSQLVLERIMSQSSTREKISSLTLTPGRLPHTHSTRPLIGAGGSLSVTNSPLISPKPEFDTTVLKFLRAKNSINSLLNGGGCVSNGCTGPKGKSVGRWLKDRRERKKEEERIHNAELHATISVASVSAAVAAITAAKAASSTTNKDIDVALASAATLVAVQCVEAAEGIGAERNHLASVVASAVNARSHDDLTTLTAAAATALRGATTLKVRALKEAWNIASVTPPQEKSIGGGIKMYCSKADKSATDSGEILNGENFPMAYSEELLARGAELLKRTRNGDLHRKIVSVNINHTGQVLLKMKSKHVAGTITKKNTNVVVDVCMNLPAWPGRNLLNDNGERIRYFGLKIESKRIVEFECTNQTQYDLWTQGVSRLLSIGAQRQNKCTKYKCPIEPRLL